MPNVAGCYALAAPWTVVVVTTNAHSTVFAVINVFGVLRLDEVAFEADGLLVVFGGEVAEVGLGMDGGVPS